MIMSIYMLQLVALMSIYKHFLQKRLQIYTTVWSTTPIHIKQVAHANWSLLPAIRKTFRNASAHPNPEGRYTREQPFCPQMSQMAADFKKHKSGLF